MIETHPNYDAAHACFVSYVADDNAQICVSTHALAETYSTLTAIPVWKINATQARQSIDAMSPYLRVITLDEDDYIWSLNRVASLGVVSGAIYDCLHARAALKAGVKALYTYNTKHFLSLGDDVKELVKEP
jgi:predicted nucleic acid-binding protein